MSGITYLKGDATCPQTKGTKIICHICNDIGGWGKGFVLAISKRWKEPEAEYRKWNAAGKKGGFVLGAVQFVQVEDWTLDPLQTNSRWQVPLTLVIYDRKLLSGVCRCHNECVPVHCRDGRFFESALSHWVG